MPTWRERILEKLRHFRAQEAQGVGVLVRVVAPQPPAPVPSPFVLEPSPAPPVAPGPLPPLNAPAEAPTRPFVSLVRRDAAFVEAAYRKYVGKVGNNGYLLFDYQNVRVATDGRNGMLRHPLDAWYNLPASLPDLQLLVTWARGLDKRPWKDDGYDCDDRAKFLSAMLGYCFDVELGMVIDYHAAHVFNIAMTADGIVYLVEPEDSPPTIYPLEAQRFAMRVGTFWY